MEFIRSLDQRGRMLTMESALPSLTLIPERAIIREAISDPFELQVDCISPHSALPLKSLVGEQMSLRLLQPDGSYRPWYGYVLQASQLGTDGGLARYRLVMGPWLFFLQFRRDSVVFQDRTVLQIFDEIFKGYAQANYRCDVTLQPRPRSLCTQYAESDLEFVARLLAEEGLSYHFEHLDGDAAQASDDKGQAKHVLVITDRAVERTHLGDARFAAQHASANLEGQKDSVNAFAMHREVHANAITLGSWDYKKISGVGGADETALHIGDQPRLEQYDGSGAYRFQDSEHAQDAAARQLASFEQDYKRFEGQGSARHFAAGCRFALVDHPLYGANTSAFNYAGAVHAAHQRPDNEFTLLRVEHHATNNLGSQAAQLIGITDLERGTYRNHFACVPAAAAVVPRFIRRPTAPGPQVALVVGVPGEAVTTDRDHRVKIRFPWQRSEALDDKGFLHEGGGGTWVRVAESSAGANWGSSFLPRQGTEVIVEFVEGDIDRPVVVGQLYNGADVPPFSAGIDSGVNHQGVVSGIHTKSLDGTDFNQWAVDDATGELRMRMLSSYAVAEIGLGHLIQQDGASAQRGAWRGAGFEANTEAWASLRAEDGLLLSATTREATYGSAHGMQMDAAEATALLRGASGLMDRIGDVAGVAQAAAPNGRVIDGLVSSLDPATSFARPWVLMESPSACVITSDASTALYSAENLSISAQGDLQETAAHTYAAVSGGTTSLFTQEGGAKVFAANGPVSVRAQADQLEILADKEVTVVSVDGEIRIQAKESVEIVAGESKVLLHGGNITMSCPDTFKVAASLHEFSARPSKLPERE